MIKISKTKTILKLAECPRCRKVKTLDAISRTNNTTEICNQCSVEEAMIDFSLIYNKKLSKERRIYNVVNSAQWLPTMDFVDYLEKRATTLIETIQKE